MLTVYDLIYRPFLLPTTGFCMWQWHWGLYSIYDLPKFIIIWLNQCCPLIFSLFYCLIYTFIHWFRLSFTLFFLHSVRQSLSLIVTIDKNVRKGLPIFLGKITPLTVFPVIEFVSALFSDESSPHDWRVNSQSNFYRFGLTYVSSHAEKNLVRWVNQVNLWTL